MMVQDQHTNERDKEALIAIVKEMTESFSGTESTKHWADDALWFDIPPFASKGIKPAQKMFDKVFAGMKSCKIALKDTEITVSADIGVVCTVQEVSIVFKDDKRKTMFVRETDCFKKSGDTWKLFHQHASVPAGGEWDGKFMTD